VAALLTHLEEKRFQGSPRFLGIDEEGREITTYIDGETVGDTKPWPPWVYAADTLDQVADWLRSFHEAVADFAPPADAVWRFGQAWRNGLIVGHNDAAPYNAVWRDGRLVAFIDWELAAPVTPEWDLAYVAFSWVPLHARDVVEAEGFSDFAERPARLLRLLRRYGWKGDPAAFVSIRPWIGPGVQIWLDDPEDPTPYWVVSSRDPARVLAVLRRGGTGSDGSR